MGRLEGLIACQEEETFGSGNQVSLGIICYQGCRVSGLEGKLVGGRRPVGRGIFQGVLSPVACGVSSVARGCGEVLLS